MEIIVRVTLAAIIASILSFHGLKKKSLSKSGAFAAFVIGFSSFSISYRFGVILILFYYTGSKLTKVKEDIKAKLEADFKKGGQRNAVQVFANSILATAVAVFFCFYIGEDCHIDFTNVNNMTQIWLFYLPRGKLAGYLWCLYLAHYSCAAADTWASEIGILSKTEPILITTLRRVPSGTNGGISFLGTFASAMGGTFIGCVFYLMSLFLKEGKANSPQYPMIIFCLICGCFGSLVDSLLGATLQATYYSKEKKMIVKSASTNDKSIVHITGIDLLSNEAVNFFSILLTMLFAIPLAPALFALF